MSNQCSESLGPLKVTLRVEARRGEKGGGELVGSDMTRNRRRLMERKFSWKICRPSLRKGTEAVQVMWCGKLTTDGQLSYQNGDSEMGNSKARCEQDGGTLTLYYAGQTGASEQLPRVTRRARQHLSFELAIADGVHDDLGDAGEEHDYSEVLQRLKHKFTSYGIEEHQN